MELWEKIIEAYPEILRAAIEYLEKYSEVE